jgi:hypothetical protein
VLDDHIAGFFKAVRELNLPTASIRHRVGQWLAAPAPEHLLLIDLDPELSRILLTEIKQATTFSLKGISLEEAAIPENFIRAPSQRCCAQRVSQRCRSEWYDRRSG